MAAFATRGVRLRAVADLEVAGVGEAGAVEQISDGTERPASDRWSRASPEHLVEVGAGGVIRRHLVGVHHFLALRIDFGDDSVQGVDLVGTALAVTRRDGDVPHRDVAPLAFLVLPAVERDALDGIAARGLLGASCAENQTEDEQQVLHGSPHLIRTPPWNRGPRSARIVVRRRDSYRSLTENSSSVGGGVFDIMYQLTLIGWSTMLFRLIVRT